MDYVDVMALHYLSDRVNGVSIQSSVACDLFGLKAMLICMVEYFQMALLGGIEECANNGMYIHLLQRGSERYNNSFSSVIAQAATN